MPFDLKVARRLLDRIEAPPKGRFRTPDEDDDADEATCGLRVILHGYAPEILALIEAAKEWRDRCYGARSLHQPAEWGVADALDALLGEGATDV